MKTSTTLQRSNFNNLANTLDYSFTQSLFNVNTLMVCVFDAYLVVNGVTYGEVTQLINNIDANGNALTSPMQFFVPITYVMGGNAGINIKYQVGDLVLVGYSQQSLAVLRNTWEGGNLSPSGLTPLSYGKFTLEDGIILAKVSPIAPTVVINIDDDGITITGNNNPIVINSGTANTTINCQQAQVTATSEIDVTAPIIKLNGAVTCDSTLQATSITATSGLMVNGKDFATHIHSNGSYTAPSGGGAVTGDSGIIV